MSNLFNYFRSTLPGAPAFTPVAGSLVDVLDTCLVTGMGLTVVNQITIESGVATIKVTGAPVALEGGLIELSGIAAPHDALNGKHRVEAVGVDTITIEATASDATLTDAGMTVRIPPLGWEILFSAGTKRIYRSLDPMSTGQCFYIDDNAAAGTVPAFGCESATAIDEPVNRFPRADELATYAVWYKTSSAANPAFGRAWSVVGDSRCFYVGLSVYGTPTTPNNFAMGWQGFFEPHAGPAGDVFNAVFLRAVGQNSFATINTLGGKGPNSGGVINRTTDNGTISATFQLNVIPSASGESGVFSSMTGSGFDAHSGRIWFVPVYIFESNAFRGQVPGLHFVPHNLATEAERAVFRFVVQNVPGLGRFLFVPSTNSPSSSTHGAIAFSIDGWRQ